MSLTEEERQQLLRDYGRRKIRHVETEHWDDIAGYGNTYERYQRAAARKCINPYTAIAILVMTACVSTAVVLYIATITIDQTVKVIPDPQGDDNEITTTNYFWDGNYFVWLIIPGSILYVLRKVRINVKWD